MDTVGNVQGIGEGSVLGTRSGPTNVLIVGVGGQGVVLISKMLARLCQLHGHSVKQSEVHGMAKRGGVVFSHVRFGDEVWSPTIPRGQADILVSLEWAEGLRWLPHLRPDTGTFICDTQQIVPPFAFRNRRRGALPAYVAATAEDIARLVPNSLAVDATRQAVELGNARAANTVLLGVLSTALSFPPDAWQPVLEEFAPRGTAELNLRAFAAGRAWVDGARKNDAQHKDARKNDAQHKDARHNGGAPSNGRPAPEVAQAAAQAAVQAVLAAAMPHTGPATLEIVDAWCKACDICVKMCPERCLALTGTGTVALTDPAACTGCRICEMLCPDFAIRVTA